MTLARPEPATRLRRAQDLNAFISVIAAEGSGPRVAVKDLVDVRGTVTTGGGRVFPRMPAVADAPIIKRLRDAGCVLVGKTNMDEWAYGATGANEHFGDVRNPWASDRIAGGSSSGSAVAVATGACDWAIGTDTGGSIRIPAALCGVVGFKPSVDMIDKAGVLELSRTLDTVGALAPDVRTAAEAVQLMAGIDLALPNAAPDTRAYRIAVPRDWIGRLDRATADVWRAVADGLSDIELGSRRDIAEPALVILDFEAARLHRESVERDGERYGRAVRAKIRRSMRIAQTRYEEALERQAVTREHMREAMTGCDALLLPTTASVAPRVGATGTRERLTRFVRPFNTTGQPVITLPAPSPGLPVGIQVIGAPGADATCAAVALALERSWQQSDGGPWARSGTTLD